MADGRTVESFINKIMAQCQEVYDRHEHLSTEKYSQLGMYRRLEMEMVDIKVKPVKTAQTRIQEYHSFSF